MRKSVGGAAMSEELAVGLFDEDKTLVLDALETQAACGPCAGVRPSEFWNPGGALQYDAWAMLGDTSATHCMELYCEIVSQDYPNWFDILVRGMSDKQRRDLIATAKECALEFYRALASIDVDDAGKRLARHHSGSPTTFLEDLFSECADDEFAAIPSFDSMVPPARYGQVSSLVSVDAQLYVSHGRGANGRLLGDLWRLDLKSGEWRACDLRWPGSPCDGMASAQIGSTMWAFRGRGRDDTDVSAEYSLNVSSLDLADDDYSDKASFQWMHIAVSSGQASPKARSMHTATAVGASVYVFGGVDAKTKRDSAELWEFNLANKSWRQRANGLNPRSAHVAVCVADRYIICTGGSNGNTILSCADAHVYDVVDDVWVVLTIDSVDVPRPRAGHSAVLVNHEWFVFGGGDNDSALSDSYALDLRDIASGKMIASWRAFLRASPVIAREGMSANVVQMPISGRSFILLHGGRDRAGKARADTLCCRLSVA